MSEYRIHPAIGVARVGDSDDYYIAPETAGGLRTDDQGRLIVLGGHGRSGSERRTVRILDYANNDGWWDDTSDGPVTARLVLDDGTIVPVETGRWVLVA